MDQFLCPKCSSTFSEQNPPKQLINCSHNLCLRCLKEQIICPVDRTRIEKRKYTIQAFQTNEQLLQTIVQSKIIKEKQNNQQNSKVYPTSKNNSKCIHEFSTPNSQKCPPQHLKKQLNSRKEEVIQVQLPCVSPQKENNKSKRLTISPKTVKFSFDTCLLHSKKADLVCLEDKCLICANCGLFGQHKLHKIISYDQFLTQYSSVTQESFKVYEQLKLRQQKLDKDAIEEKIQQLIKVKRQGEVKSIKCYINGYIDFLRRLQKQLILDLDIAIDYKKKKLQQNDGIKQLLTKKQQYVASIQTMSNGVDDIFNLQNIGQYIDYIDKESPHSFIINQGEYLIVEIDNFYRRKMQIIQQQVNDMSYQFNFGQEEFRQTIKLVSKDVKDISDLIEQNKKKQIKKPNPYSKINTPNRIQPATSIPNSNSIKISTISPNIQANHQQEQLLVGSGSKQSSKGSDTKMKKQNSPMQASSVIQIQIHHPFVKPYDTYLNRQQDDCLQVSQITYNSNIKHRKAISSINNQSAKNLSRSKKNLEVNRENELSQSRANKSRTKPPTERDTFVNALGQKSENKKKKKLDLPDKYMRIYEDLQKDKLQVLDLGGAFLGQANILTISQLFTSRCKLRMVKLMNNKISDDSFPQLISRCKYVQSINLSYNFMTQRSLDWLQQQASHLGQLKNITLSNNKIVLRNVRERLQGLARKGIKVSL